MNSWILFRPSLARLFSLLSNIWPVSSSLEQENNKWWHVFGSAIKRDERSMAGRRCSFSCCYDRNCELDFHFFTFFGFAVFLLQYWMIFSSNNTKLLHIHLFLGSLRPRLREKTPSGSCWGAKPVWRSRTASVVSSLSSSWSTASASAWTASSTSARPAAATTWRSTAGCVIPVTWPGRQWLLQERGQLLRALGARPDAWALIYRSIKKQKSLWNWSFTR